MYWAAAQLEPQRERLALHFLGQAGFEVYAPRLRELRRVRGRSVVKTPLLFPSYVFVRVQSQWYAARWAPGVRRLVMDVGRPAQVPDPIVDAIRAREKRGLVELPARFRRGDPVKILRGPFREQLALYQEQTAPERVAVLLALLGGQQRAILPADAIEPAPR